MAPTFRPGKGTAVFVASQDVSGVLNDSSYDATAGTADITTYGLDDQAFLPTQRDAQMSLSGLFDGNSTSVTQILAAFAGSTQTIPISYFPDGGNVLGRAARLMSGILTGANVTAPAVGAVSAQTSFKGTGGPRMGWSLRTPAARTSTGSGTGVDTTTGAGVLSRRALGGVAHLHVTAKTGTVTNATVKVQHSSNNSVWSDYVTFTAVTSTGFERKTSTTAVKQYVRETLSTLTGSGGPGVTYTVAFGSPA